MSVAESVDWQILPFGKYRGKTLPQVAWIDPGWICWAMKKRVFKKHDLIGESIKIKDRMMRIRVPAKNGEQQQLLMWRGYDGRITAIDAVPYKEAQSRISAKLEAVGVIDFVQFHYASKGSKERVQLLLRSVREILFGDAGHMMTRGRCDAFFNDMWNFCYGGEKDDGATVSWSE